ncbi:MAG: cyclic lactone autoinducer peptide [Clostridiales bacterium]|nr:cyclic lactone autoinducer peptide [Clostridiales bacterium]
MKNLVKKLRTRYNGIQLCNLLALGLIFYTANSACMWVIHQPKMPENAKKFRKF